MCDGQRTTLGVIYFSGMSTLFFEIGFVPGLELAKYAGLSSQQVSDLPVSATPQLELQRLQTQNTYHTWLFI